MDIRRRDFLRIMGGLGIGTMLPFPLFAETPLDFPDLAVSEGDDPYFVTLKAVEALGGMKRFVKRGDVVVVKPNIG